MFKILGVKKMKIVSPFLQPKSIHGVYMVYTCICMTKTCVVTVIHLIKSLISARTVSKQTSPYMIEFSQPSIILY